MPKFIQDDDVFVNIKATKEFTDREEPRKVFWNTYDKMKSEVTPNIHVISYYGFGGIGKSALLNKLNEEVSKKAPDSKVEFLDFDKLSQVNNNLLDILKVIRQDLKDKYNFSFPIFDLVTYVYETKLGKTASKPELNSIFDENKELGFLKDFITEIPLIGTFAKVIYYADVGKNLLKERLNNNKLRHRLEEIESLSPEDIKQYLAYYFSIDLKENIKNETAPFVFFIDTYEKLVNELNQVGDALKNDLWLRSDEGLICRVPNVLWVIAGREKLKWEDLDESWKETLDQHLLGTLSFQDTLHFLNLAGVDDEELIHQLYDLTHGTPIYLDMCVDTYVKLKEKGITPNIEDFGDDTTSLIKRFFMYMNDAERDFTTMLAFIGEWDDESIADISKKMLGSFSASLYSKIKGFSFVTYENGHYRMLDTVRDITIANANKIERQRYTEQYKNDIEDKVQEIKKMLEDTTKIAQEIKNTQTKIEESSENNKNIPNNEEEIVDNTKKEERKDTPKIEEAPKSKLDVYNYKEEYSKLILSMTNDLLTVSTKERFIDGANYLLEKIDDYEYTFNKSFYSDSLKQVVNKFSCYKDEEVYIRLQIKYEINNCIHEKGRDWIYTMWYFDYDEDKNIIIDTYEKLCKILGENNPKVLYPILDIISKRHISDLIISGRTIHPTLMKILEKHNMQNSIYYLKLLSCVHRVEFIKKMDEYRPVKIDTMYIEVLCEAIESMGSWYDEFGGKDKGRIEGARYVYRNVGFLIETLRSIPSLLNSAVVKDLMILPHVCMYFDVQETQLFDYIASIRKDIIGTTDMELIDNYYKLLLEYEHGSSCSTYYSTYNEDREKIKGLLIEIYERYSEIYGADSEFVTKIKASLLKLNITMDEGDNVFDQIEQNIKKYGVNDERTLAIATEIFNGVKELNTEYELKKATKDEQRYDNFKNMITYVNKFLDGYNGEKSQKFHNLIISIQEVFKSYQSYFITKKGEFEKYNKDIIDLYIKIDKMFPNEMEFLNNFLNYCRYSIKIYLDYSLENSGNQTLLLGAEYLFSRLDNINHTGGLYANKDFLFTYIAYRIFEIQKKVESYYYLEMDKLGTSNQIYAEIKKIKNEYANIQDKKEKMIYILDLVFFEMLLHFSEFDSIMSLTKKYSDKSNYDACVREIGKTIEISYWYDLNGDLIGHVKNMQEIFLHQKELMELCRKYYGNNDDMLLYEEIVEALFKYCFSEKGADELIESVKNRAKNPEILAEVNVVERAAKILKKIRKRDFKENYKEFDDISNIKIVDYKNK